MTRVEMMMLLKSISLFKFCSVEETMRIAAITDLTHFRAGQEVYSAGESARALYCVVSGSVLLVDRSGSELKLGARQSFGVRDILSGRLRSNTARVLDETVALEIEAEDFFDLLSNNVEIVKALFREILDDDADLLQVLA